MKTLDDIINLVVDDPGSVQQHGEVRIVERENLVLLNYKTKAQYLGRWNFIERVSRGLIIDRETREVVARPYDKFFNWGENGRETESPISHITEKVDGSLGVLFRENGAHRIATRGAFESDQALWATDFLGTHELAALPEELTLLFEIVYPDNRIIVDYGDLEALVLLDARDRHTGVFLSPAKTDALAKQFGFPRPRRYDVTTVDVLREKQHAESGDEGIVATFKDGQRFKFKNAWYLDLHRKIAGLSYKAVFNAIRDENVEELFETIPDEFLEQALAWRADIETQLRSIETQVDGVLQALDLTKSRKELAAEVFQNNAKIAGYVFAKLDGKEIRADIMKKPFRTDEEF